MTEEISAHTAFETSVADELAKSGAAESPDFFARAAACYLMWPVSGSQFLNFQIEAVWPGKLEEFRSDLSREQSMALAVALAKRA